MTTRIPDSVIEQIRRSTDIVDVISDHVQLKKQGRQYSGLCPFHGEKTPSFSVSPDKQLYHCFGCGAGGNAFTFLMELENLSFVEAAVQLGKRANIDVSIEGTHSTNVSKPQQNMKKAHSVAAKMYHHVLMLTEEGKPGREYVEERGFTREQVEYFQIGFSPDRWDALSTLLTKRNFNQAEMVEASLLGERESDGGTYDRFRNRLMFPIWDAKGQVIAFGGRTISDEKPKYLNSSDSAIFHKSQTLYGLHLARSSIRKQSSIVLFEGYVDVIAAWSAGVTNGVATLGTALTEEQARMMRRNAEMVTLCYDSDAAGLEAAYKNASILQNEGCIVKVAKMPDGYDPDDYIQAFGAERFKTDVIGSSLTLMAFKMLYLRQGRNLQDESERMRYIEVVLSEIASLKKAVERDHYIRQLADEFSLSLEALKQEQYRLFREKKGQSKREKSDVINVRKQVFETKKLLPAYQNAERILLAHMLRDEHVAEVVQSRLGGAFNVDEHQALAAYLFAYYAKGYEADPSLFIQQLTDEQLTRLATELTLLSVNDEYDERELDDYMRWIETYPKRVELQQKELEVKKEKDPIKAAMMLTEIQRLKQML
ncbi:DNA primase [Halalkalibacter sp. APA_J-10(15)]|uniref:DNA primase n=1 Tax=unclassified Halalkalibacter TaxID=2893063 RepID=UPI001FF55EF5|nr:DNA primase [Halalkalibacter sp. APA_J-10(15)]MCK0471554.1 DNA primase [Halalkalibacter sp. APA_J-10(15)]